jgi:hypothetical protein
MSIVTVATDHRFADYRAIRVRLNYKSTRPIQIAFMTPNNAVIQADFSGEDFIRFDTFAARCAECWLPLPDDAAYEFDALKTFVEKTVLVEGGACFHREAN